MAHTQYDHEQALIFDFRDDSEIAYPILPELAETRTAQGFSNRPQILKLFNSLVKEIPNASSILAIKLAETLAAGSRISIRQTIFRHNIFQRNGFFLARQITRISLLREIQILKVIEMFHDCFPGIERLRSAGAACEGVEALFDILGQTDGKHCYTSISRTTNSKKPSYL
jgi:hypothetical protein